MNDQSLSVVMIRVAALLMVLGVIQTVISLLFWGVFSNQFESGIFARQYLIPASLPVLTQLGFAWYLWARSRSVIGDATIPVAPNGREHRIETTLIQLVGVCMTLLGVSTAQSMIGPGLMQAVVERLSVLEEPPLPEPMAFMTADYWVDQAGTGANALTALFVGLYLLRRAPVVLQRMQSIATVAGSGSGEAG